MSGASFAYLRVTSIQSGTNQISTIDCLNITFTDNNTYNLINEFPRSSEDGMAKEPYSFSVTNNCSQFIVLDFGFEVLPSSNLSADYVRASFNNQVPNIVSSYPLGTSLSFGTAYIMQSGIGPGYNHLIYEGDVTINGNNSDYRYGIRPAISLKSDVLVSSGNGTSENPYVITNGNHNNNGFYYYDSYYHSPNDAYENTKKNIHPMFRIG